MPSLQHRLSALFSQAYSTLGLDPALGTVVVSERPDLSQFQANGALSAAKKAGTTPPELARRIIDALPSRELFADLSVAGPGFINITLTDSFLAEEASRLVGDDRLGTPLLSHPRKIILDFGGPNVAKPLHVGHLRPAVIGDSLQRLYRFMGEQLESDIHLGDWGTPMGMLITLIAERQPDLPYFNPDFSDPYPTESPVTITDLETLYPEAASRSTEDEEFKRRALSATAELQGGRRGYRALWQHFVNISVQALRENYTALGIHYDLWNGESRYQARIPKMVERLLTTGQAVRSEGAIVVPLGEEMPPLLLVKSDGAYLYSTTDLAAVEERVHDERAQALVYVADKRQNLHFRQVFTASRQTGIAPEEVSLTHLGFGSVNGPDGKPFKTRQGGVMKLADLITTAQTKARERMKEAGLAIEYPAEEQDQIAEKVAVAALKFSDLSNNIYSDYIFDLDSFVSFEGKTGPYLVYTAVRIKSIFRKARLSPEHISGSLLPPSHLERSLYLTLAQLPHVIEDAYLHNAPHHLCEFAFDLAQKFNRFYQECNILREEDPTIKESRLILSGLVLKELEQLLSLLGIEIPERM